MYFLSNAFNTTFFCNSFSFVFSDTERFDPMSKFDLFILHLVQFFILCSCCLPVFSYEVCGKSPLGSNPALVNSVGIIISALAKMGLNPLSSANKCCPQMSYLATQFLLPWTRVPLYIQSEDGKENAFPLTVAIKAPYYPNRKWQGRLHIYWQYLWSPTWKPRAYKHLG